jgi:O-antigen ligase
MNLINEKILMGKILSIGALAALLVVTPWTTLDPINVPKFAVLTIIGALSLALLVKNHSILFNTHFRTLSVTASAFLLFLFSAFFTSSIDFSTQLFGVNGRNTGLLTYVSLLFILLAAAILTLKGFERKLIHTLLTGGVLSVGYGLIQSLNLDPASWVNPYSPVIGFLGNPDFQSSFVGISCVAAFSLLLAKGLFNWIKIALTFYISLSIYVISKSDAQQGYLVLLAGAAVVLGIYIYLSSFSKLTFTYLLMLFVGFVVVAFGSLNKGPLASILHKESVVYRGDYWRAGWKITTENPFFGVGLDGYGDWYRRARTVAATLRRGPDVTSNAAHNVLFDLSSNGGFPLLISYLALMSVVVVAILKVIRNQKSFDAYFAALVGTWIAYNAQSVISLNQIGLAIWGWVIGGAIIGYSTYGFEKQIKESKSKGKQTSASTLAKNKVSPATTLIVFLAVTVGAVGGLPPFLASSNFRAALESGDAATIQQAAYIWPLDPTRLIQVSSTLDQNKLPDQGLKVATDAVADFPDNYGAWANLYAMSKASEQQKADALAQMRRLDPLNPNLK